MMIRYLVTLVVLSLIGCTTMGGAASLPSGDTKNWITYRVEIGDQVVRFAIPPGVNQEFLDPPVPQEIDLEQASLFNQAGLGPRLLSRHWDYKESSRGPIAGTLQATIVLWRSDHSLDNNGTLQTAIEENKKLLRIKEVLEGGSGGPPDTMQFEPAVVGGKQGLLVHHQTSPAHYAVALDVHHYLTIYVSGVYVVRPGWHEDAMAAADAILQSIRIEPKTK